jgi:hypothetical protein
MIKLIFIPIMLLFSLISQSFAKDVDSSYGELFLVEDVKISKNQFNFKTIVELDNTVEDVHGVEIEYQRIFTKYLSSKISYSRLSSTKSNFVSTLVNSTFIPAKPRNSIFLKARFSPIYGHVNFMSFDSMPLELGLNLGYGFITYDGDKKAANSNGQAYSISLDTQMQISEQYALILELEHLERSQRLDFDTAVNVFKVGVGYKW